MMKAAILLFAFIGMSMASVNDDVQDFIKITPIPQIRSIAVRHQRTDPEYQRIIIYVNGPDFKNLIGTISERPEIISLGQYCKSSGLDCSGLLRLIHDIFIQTEAFAGVAPRTIREFVDEVKAALPVSQYKSLFYYKMSSSPAFVELVNKLKSEKAKKLVDDVRQIKEFKHIVEVLSSMKLDIEGFIRAVYQLMGWSYQY